MRHAVIVLSSSLSIFVQCLPTIADIQITLAEQLQSQCVPILGNSFSSPNFLKTRDPMLDNYFIGSESFAVLINNAL